MSCQALTLEGPREPPAFCRGVGAASAHGHGAGAGHTPTAGGGRGHRLYEGPVGGGTALASSLASRNPGRLAFSMVLNLISDEAGGGSRGQTPLLGDAHLGTWLLQEECQGSTEATFAVCCQTGSGCSRSACRG